MPHFSLKPMWACAGAATWSYAISNWLKVPEDDVHVVTGSKDSSLAGRKFQFLIVSYNMVRYVPYDLACAKPCDLGRAHGDGQPDSFFFERVL